MSVRPITVSEEIKAMGHPFVNILSIFGGLQGLLMFLHRTRIPLNQNWFSNPKSAGAFAFFVLGGYLGGGLVGMAAFTDVNLLRLYHSHVEDNLINVEGQSVKNITF